MTRTETIGKAKHLISLYRLGYEREEIMKMMREDGFDISDSTYYRLLRSVGGFKHEDKIAHLQSKMRGENK